MRLDGHSVEHHVALGHRDFDRRAGRFVDRDGRERHARAVRPFRPTSTSPATPASWSCRRMQTVGRPIFFSVMIMVISFIPVFALGGMEGRMFHPLAWTKTFAMVGVSILAITLVPALIPLLIRGRLHSEDDSWLVRSVIEIYRPVMRYLLDHPWPIVLLDGRDLHLRHGADRRSAGLPDCARLARCWPACGPITPTSAAHASLRLAAMLGCIARRGAAGRHADDPPRPRVHAAAWTRARSSTCR